MPSMQRLVRKHSGWLAIPASLILLLSGCQSTPVGGETEGPVPQHSHEMAMVEGSPFQKIFTGDADFVVLTFFDLYCVACQQSAETFNTLHERLSNILPDKKIQMTGVGIGDTEFELSVFQRKYALTYDSLPDPEKSFEEPFAIRGTPTVLVFQRKSVDCLEIHRHEGRFRLNDVDRLIDKLLSVSAN